MESIVTVLLVGVSKRSKESLTRLVRHTSVGLYAYTFPILNDHEAVQQVLLDVFVEVWRSASDVDFSITDGWPWLVGLARRLAIETRGEDGKVLEYVKRDSLPVVLNPKVTEALLRIDASGNPLSAVLPHSYRSALTYDHLSELTGLPDAVLRRQVRDILRRLGDA